MNQYTEKELLILKDDVFWETRTSKTSSDKLEISLYDLGCFLKSKGFGKYETEESIRTDKDILVRWTEDKHLQLHNVKSIKDFIISYFDKSESDLFNQHNPYAVNYTDNDGNVFYWNKKNLMNRLYRNGIFTDVQIQGLETYNSDYPSLFMDERDKVFIRFKEKLIQVTKDEIKPIPYTTMGDESVWESQLIGQPFSNVDNSDEGLFEKYMKRTCMDLNGENNKDWTDNYSLNEGRWKSLKTTYGYMISQFKNPELAKCIIFIDSDTSEDVSNGRTGKSVIMNSITHWKSFEKEDGKSPKVMNGDHRLSQTKLDTKFSHIQDLYDGFDFKDMYNPIADNLYINPKNQQPFTIPFEHSPKFGITTNYINGDSDISTRGRQHFVEFGGFWRTALHNNESPSDNRHLGKLLFGKDFTDKDWNDFYNFGFRCVREFLQLGLIECSLNDMTQKILKKEIEGSEDTGEFEWYIDWLENHRISDGANQMPGMKIDDLFVRYNKKFGSSFGLTGGQTLRKKFVQQLFTICMKLDEYDYNKHKSHKGNTPTDRKQLKRRPDGSGNDDMLIITSKSDVPVSISTANTNEQTNNKTIRNDKNTSSPDTLNGLEGLFNG